MEQVRAATVKKRDGSFEPLDGAKLRRCLAAALARCDTDSRYADALAEAVLIHLRNAAAERPPDTDYVFRCCRTVLHETGMEDAAAALSQMRRERATTRRRLTVRSASGASNAWRKERVVAALERRHGLVRETARILACEVEQRVLGLDYRTVSAGLVEELIRNELSHWGIEDIVRAQVAGARDSLVEPCPRRTD